MQTFTEMHEECRRAGMPCGYFGERGEWLVVIGQNRDSTLLTQANFKATLKLLGGESSYVAVERESHWACGWVEFILVKPTARKTVERAEKIKADLEQYPVVDDDTYSDMESEATHENVIEAVHDVLGERDASLADDVEYWLRNNGHDSELESRDDQGGYPGREATEEALTALAATNPKLRATLEDYGWELPPMDRLDAPGQLPMFDGWLPAMQYELA